MLLAFIPALCLLGRRERRKQKAKGEGLQNSNAPGSWGLPENKIMMVIMIIIVKARTDIKVNHKEVLKSIHISFAIDCHLKNVLSSLCS